MNICVYQIRAVADGAEAEISIEISNGGAETQHIKGKVSAAMLSDLALPASLNVPLPLDRNRCETVLRCMKLYAAIKKGIHLLGYAKNTPKSLQNKLKMKGYPADIAEEAVAYLVEKGYIRESDDAQIFAENLANRKLYGENRIRKEMFAKGFSSDVIRETMELLDTDFAEICAERIEKMGGLSLFKTLETKNKTVAALLRYGFSYEDIREAKDLL
ncbi:MAG: regulatory protein RecX [Clostridia bacterium]|nr:regulatory protein RecX [Clostridia bacterium]